MLNKKRPLKLWLGTVAISFFMACSALAQPTADAADAKQLWQLLDYVAVDYDGAVSDGAIIDEGEYAEMLDFTENASKQIKALPSHASQQQIADTIDELRAAVERKADGQEIAQLAHHANNLLIAAYPFPVAPKTLPDLTRGQAAYAAQCAACHGATGGGDGVLAAGLDPEPIAFTDAERARSRSLMALYQAITQGVAGTAMTSFESLPEEERWALAFYVGTLSHDDAMRAHGKELWNGKGQTVKQYFPDLATLTTVTEAAAAESMQPATAQDARDIIAYLRANPSAVQLDKPAGLTLARTRLQESLSALRSGDKAQATKLALSAYLDGFEPIEPMVGARDKPLLIAVEQAMLNYRSAISRGTTEQAETAADRLHQLFSQVDAVMADAKADPTATFIGALTILLREGVEALLIVIGMIAFLKKIKRPDALRHVHLGWISAIVAGTLTWVAATHLVEISGASREVSEGVGSVLAAVILLTVGLWMHQKSSAGRWQEYLHGKLSAAMTRRSAWALFGLSFVAVYREIFETILFYSALAADGNNGALIAGFLAASALLVVIAWILLRTSARMPIGKFFSFTSILVAILAVVLAGKGISALQEAGWIGVHPLLMMPRVEWLGLYPTLETVAAQILVALVALVGFGLNWLTTSGSNPAGGTRV